MRIIGCSLNLMEKSVVETLKDGIIMLYRTRFLSGVVWSTPARLNPVVFKACWKVHRHLAP